MSNTNTNTNILTETSNSAMKLLKDATKSVSNLFKDWTDEDSWNAYYISLGVVLLVFLYLGFVKKVNPFSNISWKCPNNSYYNLMNLLFLIFGIGLLVYYSTDDFAKQPSSDRKLVLVVAAIIFVGVNARIIYRNSNCNIGSNVSSIVEAVKEKAVNVLEDAGNLGTSPVLTAQPPAQAP